MGGLMKKHFNEVIEKISGRSHQINFIEANKSLHVSIIKNCNLGGFDLILQEIYYLFLLISKSSELPMLFLQDT